MRLLNKLFVSSLTQFFFSYLHYIHHNLKIYFDFFNFDINLLNYFRKPDASKFVGRLDGSIWYSSVSKPFGGYFKIKDFTMNNVLLGEMILNAQSDFSRSSLLSLYLI